MLLVTVNAVPSVTLLSQAIVPLLAPVSVTCAPLQTVWSLPAFAVGSASIDTLAFPETAFEQAPLDTETKAKV